jgi:asparagine synthase (glutamine-hydrolysing)
MTLLISSIEFNKSKKIGEFWVSRSFKRLDEEHHYYLNGEVLSRHTASSELELVRLIQQNPRSVDGNFVLLILSEITSRVTAINDKVGSKLVYYSPRNGFTLSLSFWELVKHLQFKSGDVDGLRLLEQIFCYGSPDNSTLLNGVQYLPNASVTNYINGQLTFSSYWRFEFKAGDTTFDDKIDLLDASFKNCVDAIKFNNPDLQSVGVGISGGLDSRIIPHYLELAGLKAEGFIIGKRKPHGLFISADHVSAQQISRAYDISLKEYDTHTIDLDEQVLIDALLSPMSGSQIFKIPLLGVEELPAVLLTGSGGFLVQNREEISNLLSSILATKTELNYIHHFRRLRVASNVLFNCHTSTAEALNLDTYCRGIDSASYDAIAERIGQSIDRVKDLQPTEALMNYTLSTFGQRIGNGAFESIMGTVKSYSIYLPHLLEVSGYFSKADLVGRKLLQEFITHKVPKVSGISGQSYKLRPGDKSRIRQVIKFGEVLVRGHGVMGYERWSRSKTFRSLYEAQCNKISAINSYIDVNAIWKDFELGHIKSSVVFNVVKASAMLQLLDNHKYVEVNTLPSNSIYCSSPRLG